MSAPEQEPIKTKAGVVVIIDPDDGIMYCANCGMKVVNKTWWKEIHARSHAPQPIVI